MLYRISVAERGLTGIANIFRSRLSGLDDLLRAGTVPLTYKIFISVNWGPAARLELFTRPDGLRPGRGQRHIQ